MDILESMGLLISQPWLALAPALVFIASGLASKSKAGVGVGVLWLLYFVYELAMKYRVLCSGECNIRIDLLVVYPFLVAASVVGVVAVVRQLLRGGHVGRVYVNAGQDVLQVPSPQAPSPGLSPG